MAIFSAELFILLDVLGAELFLICFAVGLRLYARMIVYSFRAVMERLDPYFFVPSRHQIVECPSITVHAIPGYIGLYLLYIAWPTISVDT